MANYGPTPSGTPATLLVLQDHGGSTVRYYNATTSGILAGTPVIQGSLFGVAVVTIAALSWGALTIEGAMQGPKAASDGGMAAGTLAYWDDTAKVFTGTASGNTYAGKVEIAALTADTVVWVQVEAAANASGTVGWGVMPTATVAAAGTTAADAGALATGFTLVTAADATKGVKLPTAAAGKVVVIKNADAANAVLKIWPFSGDAVNAIAADGVFSIAAKTSVMLVAYDATTWYSVPLLPS